MIPMGTLTTFTFAPKFSLDCAPNVQSRQPSNASILTVDGTINFTRVSLLQKSYDFVVDSCTAPVYCVYSVDGGVNASMPRCANLSLNASGLSNGSHSVAIYAEYYGVGSDTFSFSTDGASPAIQRNNLAGGWNLISFAITPANMLA